MSRTPWVHHKLPNFLAIAAELEQSITSNQMTNYGPVVARLEAYFAQVMQLDAGKAVIATANAALGLAALVAGINLVSGRQLRYATQAFTFPCAAQGPLQNVQIVDLDKDLSLDLDQVDAQVDGILVTNLFGTVCNIAKYVAWAEANHKLLLFDNATAPLTTYRERNASNYGVGCIVSLHHTKPLGFGEGGLVIVDKLYEHAVRRCINFGFEVCNGRVAWHPFGMNAKMSELAAAAILCYNRAHQAELYNHHSNMYELLRAKLPKNVQLFPHQGEQTPFVSCFALLFDHEIGPEHLYQLELHNITARKYYTPLAELPISTKTFCHILCLPCNLEVSARTIEEYCQIVGRM